MPSFLIGLKIGTPLAARATAPRNRADFAETGLSEIFGWRGIRQAFFPVYGCGRGTCYCQAVIPTIIEWSGKPFDST